MSKEITLITPKEVLRLLPFVSRSGLYAGSRGTNALTKYPAGGQTLYCLEEVEELKTKICGRGRTLIKEKPALRRCPTKLI